jgi:hypothetical protein
MGKDVAKLNVRIYKPKFGPPTLYKFTPRLIVPPIPKKCWINALKPNLCNTRSEEMFFVVDGVRFLPENATIVRVIGSVFNLKSKSFIKGLGFKKDVSFDQTAHSPSFGLPWSCTGLTEYCFLVLKLYTIDLYSKELQLVGSTAINLFVDTETGDIPTSLDFVNHIGAFQLPVFSADFTKEYILKHTELEKIPRTPCCTILFRSDVTELEVVAPEYDSQIYHTTNINLPTESETNIYYFVMAERKSYSVRDRLLSIGDIPKSATHTEESLAAWAQEQLTLQKNAKIELLDIGYITKYDPHYGFKLIIDQAFHLEARTYPICITSFTPAYFDIEATIEKTEFKDNIVYTKSADLASEYRNPKFQEPYRWYRGRPWDPNLLAIIQLFGVSMDSEERVVLISHGWTILPIFQHRFVRHGVFKLPLFSGMPNPEAIQYWKGGFPALDEAVSEEAVSIKSCNSFIHVRLCDGRRATELVPEMEPRRDFLGSLNPKRFKGPNKSKPIMSLKPKKSTVEEYTRKVYNKFVEETSLPFVP